MILEEHLFLQTHVMGHIYIRVYNISSFHDFIQFQFHLNYIFTYIYIQLTLAVLSDEQMSGPDDDVPY